MPGDSYTCSIFEHKIKRVFKKILQILTIWFLHWKIDKIFLLLIFKFQNGSSLGTVHEAIDTNQYVVFSGSNSSSWQHCDLVFHHTWPVILRCFVGFLLATASSTNHWFERTGMEEISERRIYFISRLLDQLRSILFRRTNSLSAQLLASTGL